MITLLKLGGSLITDKTQRESFRQDEMQRIATEIAAALTVAPDIKLIIGHGSGSFGHFEAKQQNTLNGVQTTQQWRGFARVATIAAKLNYFVADTLQAADIPVIRFQPSASALAQNGRIRMMNTTTIEQALRHNLVPLVYGDVAFDTLRGGTIISTETIFTYLVEQLPVTRILLLGEVDGVYDNEKRIIDHITPNSYETIKSALAGSSGVDVTGGMLSKVRDMLALATQHSDLHIRILNGTTPGLLQATLTNNQHPGTLITA